MRRSLRLAYGFCCVGAIAVAGCEGARPPAPSTGAAAPAASAPAKTAAPPASTNKHVRVDADGRKWIADIPYDVFFEDPYAVQSNTAKVVSNTPSTPAPAANPTTAPAEPAPDSTAESGSSDWKSIVSVDQLKDETKRIRNHMSQSLQSQGTYNGNYRDLQVDGAVMAAIAGIAAVHPEDIGWKPNARFVREFGRELHEITSSKDALGKAPYTRSQAAAEKLVAVLDGSVPADAGDPAPARPFGETASRAGVMKRIEKAKDWMKLEINTEAKFKAELEKIRNEAAYVATFGAVIADESYESAGEDDYKRFAKNLIDSGREAATAAQDQSYSRFQDAINKMQKACDECHGSYGNG